MGQHWIPSSSPPMIFLVFYQQVQVLVPIYVGMTTKYFPPTKFIGKPTQMNSLPIR